MMMMKVVFAVVVGGAAGLCVDNPTYVPTLFVCLFLKEELL